MFSYFGRPSHHTQHDFSCANAVFFLEKIKVRRTRTVRAQNFLNRLSRTEPAWAFALFPKRERNETDMADPGSLASALAGVLVFVRKQNLASLAVRALPDGPSDPVRCRCFGSSTNSTPLDFLR